MPGLVRSIVVEARRRPGIGLIIAIGIALVILLSLGTWQLERRQWKEHLLAEIEARRNAPPATLAEVEKRAADGADIDYLPMAVSGTFDHAREQYFFATDDGQVGYYIYTPLRLADGRTLFVNRGFVPDAMKDPATRMAGQGEGPVTVTGLARTKLAEKPSWVVPENEPAKKLYFWKDLDAMAADAGVAGDKLVSLFLDADATPNPGGWPKGGVTQLDLPNNHLNYAFTWYGLAAVLVVVSVLAFRRKAR
ncbi:SURF1 family protein [Rhizobium sp.]